MNNNSSRSAEFKIRPSRFEKSSSNRIYRNSAFIRRPFPLLRRRMMSGRYPNIGFRQTSQPPYRQDFPPYRGRSPVCDFRYQPPSNSVFGITPPSVERPSLTQQPRGNMSDRGNIRLPFSTKPAPMFTYNENTTAVESPENSIVQMNGLNLNAELWVETIAPNGNIYYYNARTRQTTWEKPVNVQIINSDQIKRLVFNSPQEDPRNLANLNPCALVMKPPPFNPYLMNTFYPPPISFPPPPRLAMFPSPTAVCSSPRNFTPTNESIQNPIRDFKVMVPQHLLPPPMLPSETLPVDNQTFSNQMDINTESEINESPRQSPEKPSNFSGNLSKETKISDWSVSNSDVPAQYPNNLTEENVSEKMEEDVLENYNEVENITIKNCNEVENITTTEVSETENENIKPESPGVAQVSLEIPEEKKKSEEQLDKSRPTSSTPIPGTSWCVVWTGDEKVFFYNSQLKVSIWNRPEELLNRTVVDKLLEKPPSLLDIKGRTTSNDRDVKKMKTDDDTNDTCRKDTDNQSQTVEEESKKLDEITHEDKIKIFREMLAEKKVSAFSTWEKELHKIVLDSRYILLSSKERKQIYEGYVLEKFEEEKLNKQKEVEQQRVKFRSLLQEADITPKTRFNEFAHRYAKDIRFKAIERIKMKEDIFNQYISEILSKQREKQKLRMEQKKKFTELLTEQSISKDSTWSEIEKKISSDERYKAIESNTLKENLFLEYRDECSAKTTFTKDPLNVSIRNREEEVKRDLAVHLKDREREQQIHKRKAATSDFKALLNDLIKHSDISWHSAKKILRQDHRWEFIHCLDYEERENLFNEHINLLNCKKKVIFRNLLEEISTITLSTSWNDIRKSILNDPRCSKFSTSERKCEKEFKEYLKEKLISSKTQFKELLKETKIITYKSKSLLKNTKHLRDIEDALSKDKRYLILDCIRNERKEILLSYIDKLHSAGPPPPPTATDPSHRTAKNH